MKTTNNVQKTNLKAITTGLVLAVFGFSVNAQGALKPDFENNLKNQMAFAGELKSNPAFAKTATGNETNLSIYLVAENETPMEVESWMTKAENFEVSPITFENVTDEELAIEDWMMKTETFEANEGVNEKTAVEGKKMYFEFSTSKFVIREIMNEPALKLEGWMFNNKNWK